MREHKQSRIILSLLLGFILLALCLPVCAFAEDAELSDGDEIGISLTTSVPPSVISGAGAAYQKGSASGLTFKTDDSKDNLLRVLVDGQVASSDKYSVSGEPLTITLHADYLDTLSAGEHTIEIVTTNGSASAKFAAKSDSGGGNSSGIIPYYYRGGEGYTYVPPSNNPRTGDESNLVLWGVLAAVSLAGAVLIIRRRKA
jgi:hypothetical protein